MRVWVRRCVLTTSALLALVLPAAMLPATAGAQPAPDARPTGGTVRAGSASINQSGASTTMISQSSKRAVVDWQSFDVGSRQTVTVLQPSAGSVTLMRVVGPDPSRVAGKLTANGIVIITNASGLVVDHGAQLLGTSLVLAAPGVTNENFMAGRMIFDQSPKPGAAVTNAGTVTVKQTGLAAFIAPTAANAGTTTARLGRVVLAAAEAGTLDLFGDGLLAFSITKAVQAAPLGADGKPVTALVSNTGTVSATGGTVKLAANAADGIVQNLIRTAGTIAANTAGGHAGRISVTAVGASIRLGGLLEALGPARQAGGTIAAAASDRVVLAPRAQVNASGARGGGTIALGTTIARANAGRAAAQRSGASSPGFPTGTSRVVSVPGSAFLAANATGNGNGGTVTLLSTLKTTLAGKALARGGARGGNGGVVEASSAGTVAMLKAPDVSASHGKIGVVYLDPRRLIL